jgi:hypothetical protein
MTPHAIWYTSTNFSQEPYASIFRVGEGYMLCRATSQKRDLGFSWKFQLFYPENEGNRFQLRPLYLPTELHGLTYQKIIILIFTTLRASNVIQNSVNLTAHE